ncbi:hypothetical protein U9M48_014027 [Paspalum notatum var. saurae]|uniref:F-box domain-containing protein n=1 Tax=Paspalum notatum var. saurae TaxID=547442 RepID=A0AAQ3WK59_PASNO
MEKETAARQTKEQTPPATTRPPTTVNDIPDNLLHDVFRRLGSHVAAIRAAAVCTRWRRIASTRVTYHAGSNNNDFSTVLGHYHVVDPSFTPGQRRRRRVVFVPASASIDARHFALDFLPSGPGRRPAGEWELIDGQGSLLLLANRRRRGHFPDLVVCEPTTRRYVRIQPLENAKYSGHCLGVFLSRHGYGGAMGMSNFILTCVLCDHAAGFADGVSVVTARVYIHIYQPPGRSRWKYGWSSPREAGKGALHLRQGADSARFVGRSKGSIFWAIEDDGTVLAVSEGSGALSLFRLPEHVVHGGSHHRSTTFRFVDDVMDNHLVRVLSLTSDELRLFLKQDHGNGGGEWVLVRSLQLGEVTRGLPGYKECFFGGHTPKIVTAGRGYVVLTPAEGTWLFSVELGTMQVEREHSRNRLAGDVYPYELRLPPRVRVCVPQCSEYYKIQHD